MVISGPKKLIEIVKNLIEINRDVDSRYDGCGSIVVHLELKFLKGNFPL